MSASPATEPSVDSPAIPASSVPAPPAPVPPPAAGSAAAVVSRRERVRMVIVLGSLIAIGPLTIDTYLPALPAITDDLLTTAATVQLTLTGTLLGLALGQLFIGPWADAVGRKKPMIAGLTLHVLASVLCALAPNIALLGTFRVLQGLGTAAGTVVAMAVVRDLFTGSEAARLISRLMLVMGAAPILAPSLGSLVLRHTDWRGVFVLLAVLGVVLIAAAVFALPETLPAQRRRPLGLRSSLVAYRGLCRDRTFVGLVLVAGFAMASLFTYVSGSSFVVQDVYGLDEQAFGFVFGAGAVGLIAGTQLNAWLLSRFRPRQILSVAVSAAAVVGVVLVVVALTEAGGLPGLLAPVWVMLFLAGLTMPNAGALALSLHGESAGSAAAMLGAVQFGVGALAAPLVGLFGTDSGLPMAAGMAIMMSLAALGMAAVRRSPRLADSALA